MQRPDQRNTNILFPASELSVLVVHRFNHKSKRTVVYVPVVSFSRQRRGRLEGADDADRKQHDDKHGGGGGAVAVAVAVCNPYIRPMTVIDFGDFESSPWCFIGAQSGLSRSLSL